MVNLYWQQRDFFNAVKTRSAYSALKNCSVEGARLKAALVTVHVENRSANSALLKTARLTVHVKLQSSLQCAVKLQLS